mgnify:CR=1 FL=1
MFATTENQIEIILRIFIRFSIFLIKVKAFSASAVFNFEIYSGLLKKLKKNIRLWRFYFIYLITKDGRTWPALREAKIENMITGYQERKGDNIRCVIKLTILGT